MADKSVVEKARQAIMRYQEMLAMMREQLEMGEQMYLRMMQQYAADAPSEMKEKDRQRRMAENMVEDMTPLMRAVNMMRFYVHDLDRAFEELQGVLYAEKPDAE
jgi:hypothetical protein